MGVLLESAGSAISAITALGLLGVAVSGVLVFGVVGRYASDALLILVTDYGARYLRVLREENLYVE